VDDAWKLLTRAYEADPASCEDVLAQPQVGIWAAFTLRRIQGRPQPEPLWKDIGYLHTVAAACAFRAGLAFELTIPVRHGNAGLPTVGAASFPGAVTHVLTRSDGRILELDSGTLTVAAGPDDPRWHEPVRIGVQADGLSLDLTLLDRDVYRTLVGPAPPRPLSPSEVDRWRTMLAGAWRLLVTEQPERAPAIAASLRTLAPSPRQVPFRPTSASSAEAFGGILLSEPDDVTELAVTLVHEGQHLKLGALLHLLTLVEDFHERRYYVGWRDDPRPLSGLLQGLYAFAGVTDFWRVHRTAAPTPLAQFEFALWRRQVLGAADVLMGSGRLTGHGRAFVDTLRTQVLSWQSEAVPPGIDRRAEAMALDHHALWRAGCMPVSPERGAALTAACRAGEPAPGSLLSDPDQPVVAQPWIGRLDGRAVLTRHWLATGDPAGARVPGTTAADTALVSGRTAQARTAYLDALRRDPADGHALAGLGLTLDRAAGPARRALLGRPELVLALTRAGTEPLVAAEWLGHHLPESTLGTPRPEGWRVA
jgi:HEXXH motif-containing protein